jgi:hypothetical protein
VRGLRKESIARERRQASRLEDQDGARVSDTCVHCNKDLVLHHSRNLRCPDGRKTVYNTRRIMSERRAGHSKLVVRNRKIVRESDGKQPHEWRTIIVGLPIIRKLLNGEDVGLETFRINLIPDDVLFNNRPEKT